MIDAASPNGSAEAFAHARQRLTALSAADAYGHDELAKLSGALEFHDHLDLRRGELARTLTAPALGPNVAAEFKDSRRLGQLPPGDPAYLDWIAVFGRAPDKPEATWFDHYQVDQVWQTDADALAHARERWRATGDFAWLSVAMEWSDPGAGAADLVAAARTVPVAHPAFLTALYHQIRLSGFTDPAAARSALDDALAQTGLSLTTHNLLVAERVMVASDLAELGRLAPRESPCLTDTDADKECLAEDYGLEGMPRSLVLPDIRFGDEAAAIIDRLPTRERARLVDASLSPAPLATPLRLDLALSTWVRAVLAKDLTIADRLAEQLRPLLPQLEADWKTYLAARPGDDKRFAAWFILAKLPGADVDLSGTYTRPHGAVSSMGTGMTGCRRPLTPRRRRHRR